MTASRDEWDADGRERTALPLYFTRKGGAMPARIVVAHDDPEFIESTVTALRDAGYDVASFADCLSALDALEAPQGAEMLITRVLFGLGHQNGISLAQMARMKRPGIKVLFVASRDMQEHTEGVGEFLPASVIASEIVEKVGKMLAGVGIAGARRHARTEDARLASAR
jgi:DNA-binding NtrC family response regulator